jgi:hypothetical protein
MEILSTLAISTLLFRVVSQSHGERDEFIVAVCRNSHFHLRLITSLLSRSLSSRWQNHTEELVDLLYNI